ncbi:MAG: type 2 isopentenyl-diphosphate Delta-isomerase [Acidobacteria bacterium]|nr:type 2 isopentenyl-diphosphate Delta-isomerase [Acidobacteriota bacterium]
MTKDGRTRDGARDRKAEHIELALDPRAQLRPSAFDGHYLEHQALPEIDLAAVDTATRFLGRELAMPLLISCMTGGTEQAAKINRNLALAAEESRVALGIGSQRKAIEDSTQAVTFQVRELAPSVPLLANLGAVQLNYGFGLAECRRAVEMIEADALVLHLNPLQEALQPEGQGDFSGLADRIGAIVDGLDVPVIVKEIGCGLSGATARALKSAGVSIFDSAGLGGTSWARIEAWRACDPELGELFADWGVSTVESIRQLREIGGLTIIGSGGVRSGVDVAKVLALGADLAGLAQPFLQTAIESVAATLTRLARTRRELEIAMFCSGAANLAELQRLPLRSHVE